MTKINKLSRRDALKVGALGIVSGLAACSPLATATEALLPTAAPAPTSIPTTNIPVTSATSLPAAAPTEGPTVTILINDIASQATRYLDTLDESQRTKTSYAFNDPELTRWHWT